MINKFICVRLNSFYDKKYCVRLYDTHIEITRNGTLLSCQLSLDEQLYWFVQNRQLQGFGIKSKNKIKFFKAYPEDLNKMRNSIRSKIMFQNIVDFYNILNVIKQSQEDSIFKVEDKLTQNAYTLKMFQNKKKFMEEIEILKNFNNPNIVQVRECFKGDNFHYYVMEYLHGHSLKTILKITDRMTHLESKLIMNQILTALVEVQSQGIVLRNLRPDSFIFSQKNKLEGLKLIDFSYATRLDVQSSFEIQLPGYMAPEVLKKKQATSNCDLFSCGAIMFKLYTSQDLFDFNNNFEEAYHENMNGRINLEPLHLHNTPKQAMELIELMLKQQISAKDALNHDYFNTSLSPNERKKRFQKIIQANTERSLSTQLDDEKDDANTARIPTLIINKMLK